MGTGPDEVHTLLEESGERMKSRAGMTLKMEVSMGWKMCQGMVWKTGGRNDIKNEGRNGMKKVDRRGMKNGGRNGMKNGAGYCMENGVGTVKRCRKWISQLVSNMEGRIDSFRYNFETYFQLWAEKQGGNWTTKGGKFPYKKRDHLCTGRSLLL